MSAELEDVINIVGETLSDESIIYILKHAAAIATIMGDYDYDYIDSYLSRSHPDFQKSIQRYLDEIKSKQDALHAERLIAAGWIE